MRTRTSTTTAALGLAALLTVVACAGAGDGADGDAAETAPAETLAEGPSTATPPGPEPAWYLSAADADCELFVQEYGSGPDTVVVLHGGWGAEHSYLLDYFQDAGDDHHLVFYDQRGSLRSPCPDSLVSVEAHVADLDRLRAELGLERMHLAAHSMGSRLGLEYLVAHPERTGGVVLLGPVNPRPFDPARDSALVTDARAELEEFRDREACERARREAGVAGSDSVVAELGDRERSRRWRIEFTCANAFHVERWRGMEGGQAFYDASAGRAAGRSMDPEFDATGAMASHACPVRVIVGRQDWVVAGGELVRSVYGPIAGTEVTVLDSVGHALWLDAPERFSAALDSSLSEATACRG